MTQICKVMIPLSICVSLSPSSGSPVLQTNQSGWFVSQGGSSSSNHPGLCSTNILLSFVTTKKAQSLTSLSLNFIINKLVSPGLMICFNAEKASQGDSIQKVTSQG